MNGTLKVSTSELTRAAASFNQTGHQIKSLTDSMTYTVNSLSAHVWHGTAATQYIRKFNGLRDDIDRMTRMISEHASDLDQMARAYEQAERENNATASALTSDVIF